MRTRTVQSNFLSGVLDPRAAGRVETDAYNSALYTGENVFVHHLGGVRRRPGTRFIERLSNVLHFETPSAATAPNGGTASNGYDQDVSTKVTTTGNISTNNPYVVLRYDLGSSKTVRHVDINRIAITAGSSSEFALQYSTNDVTYVTVSSFYVNTDDRSYRFTPLSGFSAISARYWRIARIGGTDLGTAKASVGEFNIWTETATVSNVRIFPFELTTDEQYVVVLTDHSGFIYRSGALVAGGYFSTPYSSSDLPDIDGAVGSDSLFLVHEDHAPRYLAKDLNGAFGYNDFQTDEIRFTAVPQYDFNDTSSPTPTSEVQVITFNASWVQGDTFQAELDGARTGLVAFAGDSTADEQVTTASNIAREIQKLYTVPGDTGVTCARTNTLEYTVTLAGSSAKTYTGLINITPATIVTSIAAATSARSAAGVSRSEDVWSATRGYPRTVTFYEGRLYFGGTKSRQQSLFGSAVNNIVDFEILQALDSDPIFVTLNGQQLNAINAIFSSRNLQIFTSAGEFRYVQRNNEPITPAMAPAAQTQYGGKRVRPVAIDGSTVFVQRLGKSVRDFSYSYEEDAYTSLGLSSLAPHLINGVVDIAAWQGSSTDEINLVFCVNGDGTIALLNLRREAQVKAWTHWSTQGYFRAVGASVDDVYFAVKRTIGGTDVLYLEVLDYDMYTDASVLKTYEDFGVGADYAVSFTAGDPLVGEECRVTVAGFPVDNITPAVGNNFVIVGASLGVDTNTEVRIGLNYDPTVTPMPLHSQTTIGDNFLQKRRIRKVRVKLHESLGVLVNGRVLPDRFFDIDSLDGDFQTFSGNITLEESTNWDETEDKFVTFTQVDPLPMNILSISVDMESA